MDLGGEIVEIKKELKEKTIGASYKLRESSMNCFVKMLLSDSS